MRLRRTAIPMHRAMALGLTHVAHGAVLLLSLGAITTDWPPAVVQWIARRAALEAGEHHE
jgi:hypothetical protein